MFSAKTWWLFSAIFIFETYTDFNCNSTYKLHFSPVLQSKFVKHRWNFPGGVRAGLTKSALYKQPKEIISRVEIMSVVKKIRLNTDLLH